MSNKEQIAAKRAYANKMIAKYQAQGLSCPVIVLPEFIQDESNGGAWVPSDDVVVPFTGNPSLGYVQILQIRSTVSRGWDNEKELWATQKGKVDTLSRKYQAGMAILGKIVISESLEPTNPKDETQDVKYLSQDLADAGIACTLGGKPVYQQKWLSMDLNEADSIIKHDNHEALVKQMEINKLAGAKPSSGLSAAAAIAQEIAELSAIPKAKRTPAQKERLAEIM
jgi:hypothetical protein